VKASTVSEIVLLIKNDLENRFRNLVIEGEITNLTRSNTGHIYFSLRDSESMINCALFRMDVFRNPFAGEMKNGDQVKIVGGLGVYTKRGTFQVIVKQISKVGAGDLKEQFEKLKKELAAQGLFDLQHKKEIPAFPKRVAVITSPGGAAFQDFLNIYKRRSMWMDILLIPALVQGDTAPSSIRSALYNVIDYHLNKAGDDKKIDVIVLTRGGGSLEDLWAFNDEALAWEIYNCPIPVISAVGHEVDYSISDMVADKRTETPSAAAEMLTEPQLKIVESMKSMQRRLRTFASDLIYSNRDRLSASSPFQNLSTIQHRTSELRKKMDRMDLLSRPYEYTGYHEKVMYLEDLMNTLKQGLPQRVVESRYKLQKQNDLLHAINPKNVLGRGYSYLEDEKHRVISDVEAFKKLAKNDKIYAHFNDGIGEMKKL
jgi:exodeoxyribonuclease VII large subunit